MASQEVPLYEKCVKVYEELVRNSQMEGDERRFVGKKTSLFTTAGVTLSHYSKVFYYLSEMGCVVEEKRGSRMAQSVVRLITPPTLDRYEAAYKSKHALTKPKSRATLQSEVDTLKRRLPDVDIPSYLASLDAKMTRLEDRVDKLADAVEDLVKGG